MRSWEGAGGYGPEGGRFPFCAGRTVGWLSLFPMLDSFEATFDTWIAFETEQKVEWRS